MNAFTLEERPVRLTVAALTDTGKQRNANQDSFLVADLSTAPGEGGVLLSPELVSSTPAGSGAFELGPKGALLVVADGMGGASGGEVASRIAVVSIYQEMVTHWGGDRVSTPRQFASRLQDAVACANARIHQQALHSPRYAGMGTTVTAVGILDGFLYLAQVGDSRAYLVRGGRATQLTRDQSLIQVLLDTGQMTEEEAERSSQRNYVLQALGVKPEVEVDLTYQEIRRGDLFLLCSDGLSRVVTREEIACASCDQAELTALGSKLVGEANARGGPDNITVLVARVDGFGLEEPRDGDTVGHQVYALPES